LVLLEMLAVSAGGCVMVTVAVTVQLFASRTVTVYDPAHNPVADAVV
jgi:hypothetical protein